MNIVPFDPSIRMPSFLVPSDVLDSTSAMRPGDRLEQTGKGHFLFALALDTPRTDGVTVSANGNEVLVQLGDRTLRTLAFRDLVAYQGARIVSGEVQLDLSTAAA